MKLSIYALVLLMWNTNAYTADKVYILGVFPHLPRHKLFTMYNPVASNFSRQLQKKIRIKTKSSFDRFEAAIRSEEFDIALIQPFDYPDAHDKYHYLPLASRSDKLSSILLVKIESDYKSISDLKNLVIANPAKTAAVSRLTDRTMKKQGFDPSSDFKRTYKKNHFSCMQSVLIGASQACGTSYRALLHYEESIMRDRFRIINTSEEIPHVLYIVHKRVPDTDKKILLSTILNWPNTPEGRRILEVSKADRFKVVNDKDYDVLR